MDQQEKTPRELALESLFKETTFAMTRDIVSATITKINNNGIDVEVANFIETTIRRKELSKNKEEQNISRYNEGQKIDAKISSIDLTFH